MVKVKICGITNREDALAAAAAGCDALGFVFYKKSPRYIRPAEAAKICRALPERVLTIGVFAGAREATVKRIARQAGLDMLQFHGSESPQFCARFSGYKVIKAFRVRGRIDPARVRRYRVFAFLFDAHVPGELGGTGKTVRWSFLAKSLAGITTPVFLSGGLNERNLKKAIRTVRPQWVDASSCLEERPGKKDHRRVARFVAAAKKA